MPKANNVKAIQVRLPRIDGEKIELLVNEGWIRNPTFFATTAVKNALEKKYEEFLAKNPKKAIIEDT
ncbi:MAG: hypothetical protein ACFFG0_09615 [Candidatus Thorarchaeota archaeon]